MSTSAPVAALTMLGIIVAAVGFFAAGNFAFTALGFLALAAAGAIAVLEQRAASQASTTSMSESAEGPIDSVRFAATGSRPIAATISHFMFALGALAALWLAVVWVSVVIHPDPGTLPGGLAVITTVWLACLGVASALYAWSRKSFGNRD